MKPIPICIYGGTGVFGRSMVKELLDGPLPFQITVASRDKSSFKKCFRELSSRLVFKKSDLRDLPSVATTLEKQKIVILAAGPFQDFSTEIVRIAARQGVHYLDICDWTPYYLGLKKIQNELKQAGIVCVSGLSSLPGISVPLFCRIQDEFDHIEDIRIGLFIGNKNSKGKGAVESALQTFKADSGKYRFPFPEPIGSNPGYSLDSPDREVISTFANFDNLRVYVSFEWSWARGFFSVLGGMSKGKGSPRAKRLVSLLAPAFNLMNFIGTDRGCVSVVVAGSLGGVRKTFRSSLIGNHQGQRMASLPCVIAAEAIAGGECQARGWVGPHEWMAPKAFLKSLTQRGFEFKKESL